MELRLRERFRLVEKFVLREQPRISIVSLAAAILLAYGVVFFARDLASAIMNIVMFAVPATFLGQSIQPQHRAIIVLDTLVRAALNVTLTAIGMYVLAWWTQREQTGSDAKQGQ